MNAPRHHDDEDDWEDAPDVEDEADEEPAVPCPACGRDIPEDSPFCPYCDRYLSAADHAAWPKPLWVIATAVICLGIVIWGLFMAF